MTKAVILLSGGLDSCTCLALAKHQGYECVTLSFDYGQKQRSELAAAEKVSRAMGAGTHKVIRIDSQAFSGSALTDETIAVPDYTGDNEIPVTYVPARNTIFLSYALGVAETVSADHIFIGVSAVDYSGYPDCRPEYIKAFQTLANLATKKATEGAPLTIHTPLIHLSKTETIQLGLSLGVDYSHTVTCYRANSRGEACGQCDSCTLRKQGFKDAGITDPTLYR